MDLPEMLPLLDGWEYKLNDFSADAQSAGNITIRPGKEHSIIKEEGEGWLFAAEGTTNYFYTQLVVRTQVKNPYNIDASPAGGVVGGLLEPNPAGLWMPRYGRIPITGRKTVAAILTPERLSTGAFVPKDTEVSIKAIATNTGNVFLAYAQAAALAATTRYTLTPGEAVSIKTNNLKYIWVGVSVAGEGVDFVYEAPDTVNTDNSFTLAYTPARPLGYKGGFEFKMVNPINLPKSVGGQNTTTAEILGFSVGYAKILNMDVFRKSVKAVVGTDALVRDLVGVR